MDIKAIAQRAARHARLSLAASAMPAPETPPFVIFFINSICNLKCDHCFVWDRLNKRDDLTFEEIVAVSEDMGPIEVLNLSGGEPFMRADFAEICNQFIEQNGVKQIYVPTNGYYTEKTLEATEKLLTNPKLELFALEFSLDGMPTFHNKFRHNPRSFQMAMQTIDAVSELQKKDPRLRIHSNATVTGDNVEEIRQLTTYLFERHPAMDHHNLAILRGDTKSPGLEGPALDSYLDLDRYTKRLWSAREEGRFGSIVDPILTHTKVRAAREKKQIAPCKAGVMSCTIYANGDVSVCEALETHEVLGNLREQSFREIWHSGKAEETRRRIACKLCTCTNEVFMWPSITFQPLALASAMIGAKVWRQPQPLARHEAVPIVIDADGLPVESNDEAQPGEDTSAAG
jgi:MoaA/NifB/PqqE/SkfB family radical SAM enzyme